jgi:DNA-binding HxlR family transcriptional regulator
LYAGVVGYNPMYKPVRDVLGYKWSLEILSLLSEAGSSNTMNYKEIESKLPTSSDVVTNRLSSLVSYELISKDEKSQRDVRYCINKRGEEVLNHADEISSIIS